VSPVEAIAYVANKAANTVSVIDLGGNQVTATVTAGPAPSAVAFTPDGASAYVTNRGSNTVSVVDTATSKVTATVTVGVSPGAVAIAEIR